MKEPMVSMVFMDGLFPNCFGELCLPFRTGSLILENSGYGVTKKGGPTNPLNVTDDPTYLDPDESFLTLKQATTLINFGRVSSFGL
jgi:hypothetical protein